MGPSILSLCPPPPPFSPPPFFLNDRSTMKQYLTSLPRKPRSASSLISAQHSTAQHKHCTAYYSTYSGTRRFPDRKEAVQLRDTPRYVTARQTSQNRRRVKHVGKTRYIHRQQRQQAMYGIVPYRTTVQTCTIHYVTLVIHQDQASLPSPPSPTRTSPLSSHKPLKTCCACNPIQPSGQDSPGTTATIHSLDDAAGCTTQLTVQYRLMIPT